ncbi:MAG: hypothetical protein ABJC33_07440, partial [Betaproteobacteria bacterium]
MDRGAKPANAKSDAKPRVARQSPKGTGPDQRELEQRLADALEQQAATSEILHVISASPTDVQPVLDAVAKRAALLCKAPFARVYLVDGDMLHSTAHFSAAGESAVPVTDVPLKRTSITGRAVVDRATVHHADVVPLLASEF